jgi:hypothetical protein
MPNLDTAAAQNWLRALQPGQPPPDWPPPIRALEEPADHAAALAGLGQELDHLASLDEAAVHAVLADPDMVEALRTLLCQLGAARLLSVLHWLSDHAQPGEASVQKILANSETPEAAALRSAVRTLSRRFTLHRMFSPERLSALRAAITDADQEALR